MTANLSTREACAAADERDPLRGFRDRFDLPEGVVYLDGNSLGPMPRGALERSAEVIGHEWGRGLIRSWNDAGWFDLPTRLGDKLARIVGADQGTVVVTDTTSLNLFKVLAAALAQQRAHPERTVIVSERDNFPTDLYMAQGMIEFLDRGYELRLVDEALPLDAAVDERTAAVVLSHVNYRTGAMYDLAEVSGLTHDRGAIAIWDLAHSAGAVPVDLGGAAVDYAVGCTYKYLNAGPGGPAFAYVAPRHHGTLRQPLSGWWGHARPFAMETAFAADPGARGLLCGTQPMVSLALVECGLDIALEADIEAVRAKSLALTDLFITLVEQRCADHPLTLVTPREPARRGSHVSFRHPQGFAVMAALIDRGIIGDYREPQVLRFGVTPLYLRHTDVWDAVDGLRDILDTRSWDRSEFHRRGTVT